MQARARGPAQQAQAENVLTGALRQLFALSEAYPDLKANQNFLNLQEELTSTEDRIAYARQFYNDSVLKYNNKIQTIPSNIIAGMFNFTEREYFEAEEGAHAKFRASSSDRLIAPSVYEQITSNKRRRRAPDHRLRRCCCRARRRRVQLPRRRRDRRLRRSRR